MTTFYESWASDITLFDNPTTATSTLLIVPNADGRTSTWYAGSNFTYDPVTGLPTGGTISSISLVANEAGDPVLTRLTNVSVSLGQLGGFVASVEQYRSQITWRDVIDQDAEPTSFSSNLIVLENTDGTTTVVHGTGFTLGSFSGTIDYVEHIGTDGITVLHTVGAPGSGDDVPLGIGLVAVFPDVGVRQFYTLLNQGNTTVTQVGTLPGFLSGDVLNWVLEDGPGNDTFVGVDNAIVSYLFAGAGVQVNLLTGNATGGGGNDTFSGIMGITGTLFDDLITGDNADFDGLGQGNFLLGVDGNDTISGGGANDTIAGGQGNDQLDGGTGVDSLDYAEDPFLNGGVTVSLAVTGPQNTGGAGIDTIVNFENLRGGNFSDSLTGNGGANLIVGDASNLGLFGGNDSLVGGAGNDTLVGGAGNDNMLGNQDNDEIVGGAGDDYAHGGQGNDTMNGDDGNDRLDGGAGADTINGGTGSDIMIANQGDDLIIGGADGDYMHGGQNNDTLQGGDGNDVLVGGIGSDSIDGGNGFDGAAWVGLRSAYTVTNNGGGSWTVANISTGDTDAVTGVEFLVFDDQIVT